MQPSSISKCTGRWTKKQPCCIPRSCPDPHTSNFRNGTIKGSAYFYPETIELMCNNGHHLVGGGPYFQCNVSGQWEPIDKLPDHTANTVAQRIRDETKQALKCAKARVIVTKPAKSEIRRFPTCEPKHCGEPIVYNHCQRIGKFFHFPGVVHFNRNPDYCVVGNSSTECTNDGVWSSLSPQCARIQCAELDVPSHGAIKYSLVHRGVQTIASFTCKEGYDLNMDRNLNIFTRQCTQLSSIFDCTGRWTEKQPCCIPRSCPDPHTSNFHNGTIKGRAYFYPETIELMCNNGHHLVGGGPYFRCSISGQWEPIDKLQDDNTQTVVQRIRYETERALKCVQARVIVTKPVKSKIRQFPTCEPKHCGKPIVNRHCQGIGEFFHFPGVVHFNRDLGYCVVGNGSTECTSDGIWSSTSPKCARIQCPELEVPSHGDIKYTHDNRIVGTEATYTCENGYDLNMRRKLKTFARQCMQPSNVFDCTGQWMKTQPCCIPRSCSDPNKSNFVNGSIEGEHYFYPEIISLICDVGHILSKDGPYYRCNESGSWEHIFNLSTPDNNVSISRAHTENEKMKKCLDKTRNKVTISTIPTDGSTVRFPQCTPVNCGKPTVPDNGTVIGLSYHYPFNVTFECDPGFYITECVVATCNASGQWSHASPKCFRVKCPNLTEDHCRRYQPEPSKYVDYQKICVLRKCGYWLDGPLKMECKQYDNKTKEVGYWTQKPTCIPTGCRDPPPISNGSCVRNGTGCKSKIYCRCNEGYEMKDGNAVRICSKTCAWTGLHPRCQQVCAYSETKTSPAQTCLVKGGKREFACLQKEECPSDYTPICASDTVTYNNKCLMKLAGCNRNKENDTTTLVRQGQCSFGGVCFGPKPAPPPGKHCRGVYYRYYHNSQSGECERYVHGNCYEGHNIFYTVDDCKEVCVKKSPCFLDLERGLCGLSHQRFFYNITEEKCQQFTYNGCFGNENNFRSKETCEIKCNGTRIEPSVPTKTPEECCPPTLKKQCSAELVLDLGVNTLREGQRRQRLAVRLAPKTLSGKTVSKYRKATTLSLPRSRSQVEGCSMKCPKLSPKTKYLALVKDIRYESLMVSSDIYNLIPYSSGEKTKLLNRLKTCK